MRSNTCYCCDLLTCDRWIYKMMSDLWLMLLLWLCVSLCYFVCVLSTDYQVRYYQFTGVRSCWDVVYLYRLLWVCVTLNVLGVFLGIITAAILGAFKGLVSEPLKISSQMIQFSQVNRLCICVSSDSCRSQSNIIQSSSSPSHNV